VAFNISAQDRTGCPAAGDGREIDPALLRQPSCGR
jgi:hypothetical protein